MRLAKTLILSVPCVLLACKATTAQKPRSGDAGRRQFSEFYATGQTELRNKNNFYYAIFNQNYELQFDKLPTSASVSSEKTPYVGGWYPQKTGGTSRDSGSGNVLQKYDQVFNAGQNKAQQWEKLNHTVTETDPSAGWAGHCNGFSASAQRHAEPKTPVSRGGTTFSPKDIKALLAEIHMSAKFYFLGGNRCQQAGTVPSASGRLDPFSMGDCDDVNPASFHAAVTNWIGIQKHTLIIDTFTTEQVWNYPHFKYVYTSKDVPASEAMRLVTGSTVANYKFNAAASSFRSVTMTITYSKAYAEESMTSAVQEAQRTGTAVYQYIIELDASGRMIGGEWALTSQQTHPDFIWVALEPALGDGSKFSANPHVQPNEVIKLWAESIGADPNSPPLDIKEPLISNSWGQFPKFEVAINGSRTGSVFLGRPLVLKLNRKSILQGDLSVDVTLDGKAIGSQAAAGSDAVSLPLPSIAQGEHSLEFQWKRGTEVSEYQRVKFIAH